MGLFSKNGINPAFSRLYLRLHIYGNGEVAGLGKGQGGQIIALFFLLLPIFFPAPGIEKQDVAFFCRIRGAVERMGCADGQSMLFSIIFAVNIFAEGDFGRDNVSYGVESVSCDGRVFGNTRRIRSGRIENPSAG